MSRNAEIEKKIKDLVSQMTLDEKIGMIHGDGLFRTKGVERLGIPEVTMSDGPMGVRNEFENAHWIAVGNNDDYVTYLPSNSAIASTWNREIARESGEVLGEEARGRGKDVILAPGINIKRSPLCGRNFEYMSEDPYLTGELAVPLIQGIQTKDTAAVAAGGLDIEMSVTDNFDEYFMAEPLKKAVESGEIPESLIDEKVQNIIRMLFRLHKMGE